MPFAGFLVSQGRFSFVLVLAVSAVGGLMGALTSYVIGYAGTAPFVRRFGAYVRVSMNDLERTHAVFARYGDRIVLISRFIPVVRQFVSIPAGAGKMPFGKFCLYTVVGSTLWNSVILGIGYALGEQWETFQRYGRWIDAALLVAVLCACVWWIYRKRKRRGV